MKNKNFLHSLVKFMFNAKVALSEVTLEDGSIIEIDDTTMIASKLLPDNTLEVLAEGTYRLMDGTDLVVGPDGVVQPQVDPNAQPVAQEEIVAEEVKQESISEFTSQIETFANKNMILENEKIALQEQLNLQTEKFNALALELENLKKTSIEKLQDKFQTENLKENKKGRTWADVLNK
jgi:hypothetical protein